MNDQTAAHDIAINGMTLHVATWGRYTTPERAVVLVHGITASHLNWAEYGPYLAARGWYAIAPDLRGRGLSEKPPHGYGLPYHANDLLALCDHFGLPRMNLVGHSLGAMIGLFLGAIHPDRLARLVLIDAGGTLPPDTMQALAPALSRLGTMYSSLDDYLTAMRAISRFPWEPFGEAYFRYDADVRPDGTVTSRVPKAVLREEVTVNATIEITALPARVTAPTLIVRATVGLLGGERGLLLPPDEAERLHGRVAGSQLIAITGADHYTVVLAEQFVEAATTFLEG
ncbi:MAG: alpha/beta fold hydrolase [Thermomicrobiales bacterium]